MNEKIPGNSRICCSRRSSRKDAKHTILAIHDAEHVAQQTGAQLIEVTGMRGSIGALAAIGCFDLGLYSAGLPEDFKHG